MGNSPILLRSVGPEGGQRVESDDDMGSIFFALNNFLNIGSRR